MFSLCYRSLYIFLSLSLIRFIIYIFSSLKLKLGKMSMCGCSYMRASLTVPSMTGSLGKGGGRDIMLHHYKVNCIAAAQTSLAPSFWYPCPHFHKITQHMSSILILSSLSLTMGGHISRSVSNSLSISLCNWVYYGTGGNEHHGHGSMRIEKRARAKEREQNATAASGNNKTRLQRRKTVLCPRREEWRGKERKNDSRESET